LSPFFRELDTIVATAWISVRQARTGKAGDGKIEVRGWVRTRRDSKAGFSFLELNDGSSLGNLQVIAPTTLSNYETEVRHLTAGCSVVVYGGLQLSQGAEQSTELLADRIELVGLADPESYPLQKKRHTLEKLREWSHLRPRTNTIGAVMRVRNRLSFAVHEFFQQQGFLYIQTPVITTSDCEGAGELFRVTTLDLNRLSTAGAPLRNELDFFGRPAYLTVSGQLEAEAYATALGKVYTFGPTFRAENSNTSRHLAEFWMIEPEAAFFALPDNMRLATDFLKFVLGCVLNDCQEDMAFFDERVQPGTTAAVQEIVEKPFTHLTYSQGVEILQRSGKTFEYPVTWGTDLQAEHERFLTEEHVRGPLILTDYPSSIKPFYMRLSDDGRTVAAMDVLVPRVGEIIGGSQREERLEVLESRMVQSGLPLDDYQWFIDLRRYGTVPHSGFGLGLERLVQFATGMANIRDVIPFPRTPGSAVG
jgi:asparaginyl-tRNA synthetase